MWLIIIEISFVWFIFFIMSSMEWMPWRKNIGVNDHERFGLGKPGIPTILIW